jgi:hypothetical protein
MIENLDVVRYRALEGNGTSINCKSNVVVTQGDLGLGLFANRDIRVGEEILMFEGPLVDFAAAVAKGEKECYPLQVSPDEYIDLSEPGCFANHSCDPNAGLRRLTLIALCDIPKDIEIRYDYSTTMDEDSWTMRCLCQSPPCRRTVTDFKDLHPDVRRHYLELDLVQPFIACQYDSSSGQRIDILSPATRRASSRQQSLLVAAG